MSSSLKVRNNNIFRRKIIGGYPVKYNLSRKKKTSRSSCTYTIKMMYDHKYDYIVNSELITYIHPDIATIISKYINDKPVGVNTTVSFCLKKRKIGDFSWSRRAFWGTVYRVRLNHRLCFRMKVLHKKKFEMKKILI